VPAARIACGVEADDRGVRDLPLALALETPLDGGAMAAGFEDGIERSQRLAGRAPLFGLRPAADELPNIALGDIYRKTRQACALPGVAIAMPLDLLALFEVNS